MDEPVSWRWEILNSLKKYCPNLVVFINKDVTVTNPKLGLLNGVLFAIVTILSMTNFLFLNKDHEKLKDPVMTISICGFSHCIPPPDVHYSAAQADLQGFCNDSSYQSLSATMDPSHVYDNIDCAGTCGASSGDACILPSELVQVQSEEVFFPTFFQETYTTRADNVSCPTGFMLKTGPDQFNICQKTGNHFVAGAKESRLIFYHEFYVEPHRTMLDIIFEQSTRKSHSGSFQSQGWDVGLVTHLMDRTGSILANFDQSSTPNITLEQLFRAAQYDGADAAGVGFDDTDNRDDLSLDSRWGANDLPVRLTGAELTVDIYTTDTGLCPVHDVQRNTVIRSREVTPGVPVTCLTVFINRLWTYKETTLPLNGGKIWRTRRTHGIKVNFRKMGGFGYVDDQIIFNHVTVLFVWFRIPLQLTTLFGLWCLGKLSHIYGRVLREELNLKEACKGLMARLMHHSAAFMDLKDHDAGISKRRIHDRFKDFLLDNEDIDEEELTRFVEFVFDGLKGTGHHPNKDKQYVSLQEFCEVCSSNEPLNFQALVRLFDQDRKQGLLESFFLDPSLKELQYIEAPATLKIEPLDYTKVNTEGGPAMFGGHSRIESVSHEVDDMMRNLKTMEGKALKTAGNLEIGTEVIGLRTMDEKKTAAPKLQQSESFCSIADEEDECAGGGGDGASMAGESSYVGASAVLGD